MSVARLQALMDSFDEDGSGFVTVKEVNELTQKMPVEWRFAIIRSHMGLALRQLLLQPTGNLGVLVCR